MSGQTPKIYFPNLNGLRFIAAFVVIIHHLEQIKLFFGLPSLFFSWHFIKIVGELGVTLFFTLSGFLITYLLLVEKDRFGTIDVKAFYIRRVLRIWPLYYLIIILGLFVLPHIDFFKIPIYTEGVHYRFNIKVFFYLILFPNVISNLYAYMPYIAQAWSIGIEEQFYLVWPWIVKKTTNYLRVLFYIAISLFLITTLLGLFADHSPDLSQASTSSKIISFAYRYMSMLRIGCMAIGGIGAYYLHHSRVSILQTVFSKPVQIITLVGTVSFMLAGVEIPYINHEFYSCLFLIIILNLAANPNTVVSFENKIMNYLGKISYSIYMWHNIAIIFGLYMAQLVNPQLDDMVTNVVYYLTTFIITFLLSAASYELFEKQFLRFKHLFTKVKT